MNSPSSFQLEYPLSVTRKFWKKIVSKSFIFFVYSFIVSVFIGAAFYSFVLLNKGDFSSSSLLAKILLPISIFFLAEIVYSIYVKIYIDRYYYDCGDNFITIKKGVFAPTEIHVQYQKIQDVYVDQDILDRIFGIYDVHIASATVTSGIEAHIDGVNPDVAEKLKNLILNKINNTDQKIQPILQNNNQNGNFKLNEKISSKDYPITDEWTVSSVIMVLIGTIIAAVISSFGVETIAVIPIILMFSIIFVLIIGGILIWKKNYYFEFMEDYILLKTSILNKEENHLPYKSIQNVTLSQGVIDRLFGIATVIVENAASKGNGKNSFNNSTINIVGQPLKKAEHINQILNGIVSSIKNSGSMGV